MNFLAVQFFLRACAGFRSYDPERSIGKTFDHDWLEAYGIDAEPRCLAHAIYSSH